MPAPAPHAGEARAMIAGSGNGARDMDGEPAQWGSEGAAWADYSGLRPVRRALRESRGNVRFLR